MLIECNVLECEGVYQSSRGTKTDCPACGFSQYDIEQYDTLDPNELKAKVKICINHGKGFMKAGICTMCAQQKMGVSRFKKGAQVMWRLRNGQLIRSEVIQVKDTRVRIRVLENVPSIKPAPASTEFEVRPGELSLL